MTNDIKYPEEIRQEAIERELKRQLRGINRNAQDALDRKLREYTKKEIKKWEIGSSVIEFTETTDKYEGCGMDFLWWIDEGDN